MKINSIYENGNYLDANPTWHAEDSPWKAGKIAHLLKKNKIIVSTICEIGCGAGEILKCLANEFGRGVVFSGYEISPQAYAVCSPKEKENLHFFHKDLFDVEELKFDVAMAIDVFEHVEDYFGFLRKFKKKGIFKIFHIPLDLSAQTVIRRSPILKSRSMVGHLHYFTKETALATLKDTGYEVIDFFYTGGSLDIPNQGWKSKLLKLPRKILFSIHQDLAVRLLGGFSLLVLAK